MPSTLYESRARRRARLLRDRRFLWGALSVAVGGALLLAAAIAWLFLTIRG